MDICMCVCDVFQSIQLIKMLSNYLYLKLYRNQYHSY